MKKDEIKAECERAIASCNDLRTALEAVKVVRNHGRYFEIPHTLDSRAGREHADLRRIDTLAEAALAAAPAKSLSALKRKVRAECLREIRRKLSPQWNWCQIADFITDEADRQELEIGMCDLCGEETAWVGRGVRCSKCNEGIYQLKEAEFIASGEVDGPDGL